jgi:tetratricopeptide (TPR) repeat protein
LAAGHYSEADEFIKRWLSAQPRSAEAHFLNARVALGQGKVADVTTALARAEQLGHSFEQLDLLRALIAAKAGRRAEAEPLLRRALFESREPDAQLDEALAEIYLESFDLKRASEVVDRWARDAPDDPKPYLWRADIDGRKGSDQAVILKDYQEALRRSPGLAKARLGLADELRKAHRIDEALAEYEAYIALKPDDPAGHLGAGQSLVAKGDDAGAAKRLERALALDPNNSSVLRVFADLDLRRGAFTTALTHIDRAIALDPLDLASRGRRVVALTRLGRLNQAREEQARSEKLRVDLNHLQKVRERLIGSPHDHPSQNEVARWMFDHGKDKEGARWAELVLREQPGNPEASRLLAEYHERQGNSGLANFYRLHAPTRQHGDGSTTSPQRK